MDTTIIEDKLSKFESIFESIERRIMTTNLMLGSLTSFITHQDKATKTEARLKEVSTKPPMDRSESVGTEDSFLDNMVKGLGFWLSNNLLGKASTGVGLAFSLGLLTFIKKPLTDFVGTFISEGLKQWLPDMGIPDAYFDAAGETIASGGFWALAGRSIGLIFGKKFGIFVGLTGFLSEQINKMFDPSQSPIGAAFEEAFGEGSVGIVGGAIGTMLAIFLPSIIMKGISGIFKKGVIVAGVAVASKVGGLSIAATVISAVSTGMAAIGAAIAAAVTSAFGSALAIVSSPIVIAGAAVAGTAAMVAKIENDGNAYKTVEVAASKAAVAGKPEEAAEIMKQVSESSQFFSPAMQTPEYWMKPNVISNAAKLVNETENPVPNVDPSFFKEDFKTSKEIKDNLNSAITSGGGISSIIQNSLSKDKTSNMFKAADSAGGVLPKIKAKIQEQMQYKEKTERENMLDLSEAFQKSISKPQVIIAPSTVSGGTNITKGGDSYTTNSTTIYSSPASSLDTPYLFGAM